jgi:hypothetical protein
VAISSEQHWRKSKSVINLPATWHREHEWMTLFNAACGPPAAAA